MRDIRSDTLPDIFAVVGVELRVGSKSECAATDDNTLVSLLFSSTAREVGRVASSIFSAGTASAPDSPSSTGGTTGWVWMVMSWWLTGVRFRERRSRSGGRCGRLSEDTLPVSLSGLNVCFVRESLLLAGERVSSSVCDGESSVGGAVGVVFRSVRNAR